MPTKQFKPVTAGTRFRSISDFGEVTHTGRPEKKLTEKISETGGRNHHGHITSRRMGGGHKRIYRIVDFKRNKKDVPATVKSIEYDPNRTAFIALLNYADGEKRYIIAPQGLQVGATVVSGDAASPEVGNTLLLKNMPLGNVVHNIELQPGRGGAIARSAGTYAQLNAKEERYAVLKMPSGELRRVLLTCTATVGTVSNSDHQLQSMGKAGRNRWKGIRPRTRGVAMNPVDHPMGGGEGRSSGGHPRSRSGKYAKGEKTRSRTKASNKLILQRKDGKKLSNK